MGWTTRELAGILLVFLLLVGCGGDRESAPAPTTRPVKIFLVEGGVADALRSFPGRVDATQRAELAFRVPGQLREILVKEGDLVEAGQVLARLDPADYELEYEDRRASYDIAQRNFQRGKELIVDGNISRMEYDRMEAEFRTASAALSLAEKNLEYTVLTSPFAGRLAERQVENFEDVAARQTAFSLQNINQLDIIIDLPESLVRMVRADVSDEESIADDEEVTQVVAHARFEGRPGDRFLLRPKEIATKSNELTQTYRTTFTMDAPATFTVLPGMTATVLLDLSYLLAAEKARQVPVRAVMAGEEGEPQVWILDPDSMTVSSREVSVGRRSGGLIEIPEGLLGGEEIVAVGAQHLSEGMRVTRMVLTEQAVPRDDDPL